MKKLKIPLAFLCVLLFAAPGFGAVTQDVGYFNRNDCGTLNGVSGRTVCLQTTTVSGRTAGKLYVFTGGAWVEQEINRTAIDNSGKTSTAPVKAGLSSATPSSCLANKDLYIKTDATAGQQLFICNGAGNGFNLVGDGGGGGGGSGDVTMAANSGADNRAMRSDGTLKGVQASLVGIDDSGNITTPGDITQGSCATNCAAIKSTNITGIKNFELPNMDATPTQPVIAMTRGTIVLGNQVTTDSEGALVDSGFAAGSGGGGGSTVVVSATVNTLQSTTSAFYTDLSTPGPAVTVTTGTSAIVILDGEIDFTSTALELAYIGITVSGATTIAASDANALAITNPAGVQFGMQVARTFKITGLTPGSNTFTLKYKTLLGNSVQYRNRDITVIVP